MIEETYTRVFVDPPLLDETVLFYQSLLAGEKVMQFSDPKTGLDLAIVRSPKMSILIIAGTPANREPFEETRVTIRVSNIEDYAETIQSAGATKIEGIQQTPVGHKMRYRHRDGLVVEYVDWRRDEKD